MEYHTEDCGEDLFDIISYFHGRDKRYFDAEEFLLNKLYLEYIKVTEGSHECTYDMKKLLTDHDFATPASHLIVEMRSNIYSRITFNLEYFPGTCAWLVVTPLAEAPNILDKQLYVAEQIAIWTQYGAIMCSHTQDLEEDCVDVLEEHGYASDSNIASSNPHTGNTKWLWFKSLAAPIDEYKGSQYHGVFSGDTLDHLDYKVRSILDEEDNYDDDY